MADEVRRVVGSLEDFTERLIRQLTVNITDELIRTTPVDTGWARANWVPQIGVPFIGNSDDRTPTPADVSGATGQQQQGLASVVGTYRLELGAVFISNNVPYILSLNDGSSNQAPAMFVEGAIERGIRSTGAR